MKYAVLLFLAIIITGCTASGDRFSGLLPESNESSAVYIYRPSKFFQGGTWPTIFVNNEEKYSLKNGGFVYMKLPQGEHDIRIGSASFLSNWAADDINFKVNVTNGQQYFYRFDLLFGGVDGAGNVMSISGTVSVNNVDKLTALEEMKELKSSM